MRNRTIVGGRLAALLTLILALGACDHPLGHDHDHLQARGVVITDLAGQTLAETHGSHWHYRGGGSDLHLHRGEELDVRIWFVDPAGQRFQLAGQRDYQLVVQVADPAVARYDGHGDHGHFEGLAVGRTTAVIHLWHGAHPAGHPDYSSPPLTLDVVAHSH